MVDYRTKTVNEEVDILSLNEDEYDRLNNIFREVLRKRGVDKAELHGISRIVVINGYNRAEFLVEIKNKYSDENKFGNPTSSTTSITKENNH